jgi:hypothetical protein
MSVNRAAKSGKEIYDNGHKKCTLCANCSFFLHSNSTGFAAEAQRKVSQFILIQLACKTAAS